MTKRLLIILIIGTLGCLVAGCSGGDNAPPKGDEAMDGIFKGVKQPTEDEPIERGKPPKGG